MDGVQKVNLYMILKAIIKHSVKLVDRSLYENMNIKESNFKHFVSFCFFWIIGVRIASLQQHIAFLDKSY